MVTTVHAYWAQKAMSFDYFDMQGNQLPTPTVEWLDLTPYAGTFKTKQACEQNLRQTAPKHQPTKDQLQKAGREARLPLNYTMSNIVHHYPKHTIFITNKITGETVPFFELMSVCDEVPVVQSPPRAKEVWSLYQTPLDKNAEPTEGKTRLSSWSENKLCVQALEGGIIGMGKYYKNYQYQYIPTLQVTLHRPKPEQVLVMAVQNDRVLESVIMECAKQ